MTMRRQHRYHSLLGCILAALSLVCAVGCNENLEPPGWDGPAADVTLHLSTGSTYSRTRAFDPAADNFDEIPADLLATEREEAIHRVDFFFFKSDAAGNRASGSEEDLFYVYEVTNRSDVTTADVTVKLPIELSDKFVQNGSEGDYKAYVYVLVNLPETIKINMGTNSPLSFETIQALEVEGSGFTAIGGPSDFVMRGGAAITMVKNGNNFSASGTISLERLAAKIRLWANIAAEIYIDPETGRSIQRDQFKDGNDGDDEYAEAIAKAEKWIPVTKTGSESNVDLYIYNVATKGRIDAALPDDPQYADIDRTDANKAVRKLVEISSSETGEAIYEEKFPYTHTLAYYSYPNVWSNSASADNHQTYLILRLPWQRVEEGGDMEFQNFYYQIPVNLLKASEDKAENCLAANHYYRTKITIGMLGSKDMGDPLEVEASCEVVPWRTADVDVSIKGRRYLVVNQTEWTMNNTWTLEIPFSSSHPVEVVDCYVNYFRYNDTWGTDYDAKDSNDKHESPEFTKWLALASAPGNKIIDSEGEITQSGLDWGTTGEKTDQMLYYKKKYFYDEMYDELGRYDDADESRQYGAGFKYYVGHEHPKTFQKTLVARPREGLPQEGWDEFENIYRMKSVYTCKVDNNRQVVMFDHPLVWWKEAYSDGTCYYVPEMKDGKLRDEYSRCEIIIKIRQTDRPDEEHLFEETIHITQYPGLYVEVSHDYGNIVTGSGDSTEGNEYVLVNGHKTETDGIPTNWNEVSCYMSSFGLINNNPNMYVIHTTQLSEENDGQYILGDPRSLYYNNQLGIDKTYAKNEDNSLNNAKDIEADNYQQRPQWNTLQWRIGLGIEWYFGSPELIASAPRLSDAGNRNGYLQNYYPSDETEGPGSKENFVAPVFRVASSFGKVSLSHSFAQAGLIVTNYLDRESRREARRRCAAYQEAGRPAGRWRVPTIAEIEYVMQLSADKKIPHLFGLKDKDNELYWCSTGLLSIDLTKIDDSTDHRTARDRITKRDATYDIPRNLAPAVRCVYDEWYWTQVDGGEFPAALKDGPLTKTFYWGDRKKDNPQAPLPPQTRSLVRSQKK